MKRELNLNAFFLSFFRNDFSANDILNRHFKWKLNGTMLSEAPFDEANWFEYKVPSLPNPIPLIHSLQFNFKQCSFSIKEKNYSLKSSQKLNFEMIIFLKLFLLKIGKKIWISQYLIKMINFSFISYPFPLKENVPFLSKFLISRKTWENISFLKFIKFRALFLFCERKQKIKRKHFKHIFSITEKAILCNVERKFWVTKTL